jgi:hypothetical protein
VSRINSLLADGVSFRTISNRIQNDDKLKPSLQRHAENCLKIAIAAVIAKKKEQQGIDIHKEFEENLAFARTLRLSAYEYLSDPVDPLKIAIVPFAHEIDVTYFDMTDLVGPEDDPKPKKKTAKLSMLLAQIEQLRNFEVDKISIKHVDLRSFALDCIRTVDVCVDKFARIAGAYKKDSPNPNDTEAVAKRVVERLVKEHGWTEQQAREHVSTLYEIPLEQPSDAIH